MYNIIGLGNQIEKDLFCARFPKQPLAVCDFASCKQFYT